MRRRPPTSTRTNTLFPYPTPFRSTPKQPSAADARSRPAASKHRHKRRKGGTILLPGSSPAAGIRFCCLVRSEPRSICLTLGREAYRLGSKSERSEEHTSELQSLMRISYAVFCLKKKKHKNNV